MRLTTRWAVITGIVAVVTGAAAPTVANADDAPSGRQFGQHVMTCAQTMGFDGEHNPGMHRGLAGWNGMACELAE
jgi:hypothetical protein